MILNTNISSSSENPKRSIKSYANAISSIESKKVSKKEQKVIDRDKKRFDTIKNDYQKYLDDYNKASQIESSIIAYNSHRQFENRKLRAKFKDQFEYQTLHGSKNITSLTVEAEQKLRSRSQLREINKRVVKCTKHQLRKKIRNKIFAHDIVKNLISANPKSRLLTSYYGTLKFCQKEMIQEGFRIKMDYCNCRHCYSCNRIRTGKLMNQYRDYVEYLNREDDMYMVSLTIPSVSEDDLSDSISQMNKFFVYIKDNARKSNIEFEGLRKMECTHGFEGYHPHFHILIKGLIPALYLYSSWFEYVPEASALGQDIKPANKKSAMELFKYFTKFWTKSKGSSVSVIDYHAQDIIYQAIIGKRIFQPFGKQKFKELYQLLNKQLDESEDVNPVYQNVYNIEPDDCKMPFHRDSYNYIKEEIGQLVIDFKLNKKDEIFLKQINDCAYSVKEKRDALTDPLKVFQEIDIGSFDELNKFLNSG